MKTTDSLEVWQRGPVEGVPGLLQPVAHALLQSAEDVEKFSAALPDDLLWQRPGGVASVGFHLLHLRGVIDRLFTYARGELLTSGQLMALTAEKEIPTGANARDLVKALDSQVEQAIDQLRQTPESSLLEPRALGRKRIPTTVLGLLFHAAEHCQRHTGQLLVTARVLQAGMTSA